jgi:Tol biopolymer transport system component
VPDLEQRLRDAAPDRERMPRDLEDRIWANFVADAPRPRQVPRRGRRVGRPVLALAIVGMLLAGAVLAILLRHPSPSAPPATHPHPAPAPTRPAGAVFFVAGPDGDHLALYEMQADGSTPRRQIAPRAFDLHISPDGLRAEYGRWAPHGVFQLVIQPVGRGKSLVITKRHGQQLGTGEWSPDGSTIAFEGTNGIYTLRTSDGGGLRRVTRAGRYHDVPIAFSPDGTRILLMRTAQPGNDGGKPMNLYSVRPDGSGLTRLNPPGTLTGMSSPVAPAGWSPDGRRVVFVAGEAGPYASGASVYVADADGRNPQQISTTGALFPSWSPDGKWIAYDVGPHHELFVSHPDGTALRQLTGMPSGPLFTWAGVWSPDSRSVLIQRGKGCDAAGCDDLWIVPIDGSGPRQVTHQPGAYDSYTWRR